MTLISTFSNECNNQTLQALANLNNITTKVDLFIFISIIIASILIIIKLIEIKRFKSDKK